MVDIIVGDEQWMKLGEDGTQLNELDELDLGDWNPMMADAAAFFKKRDYKADPSSLQIIYPTKPDYVCNFWLSKAEKQFPLLAVAANKLLSAHATTAAAERNWSAWGRTTACATTFALRQLRKWCM